MIRLTRESLCRLLTDMGAGKPLTNLQDDSVCMKLKKPLVCMTSFTGRYFTRKLVKVVIVSKGIIGWCVDAYTPMPSGIFSLLRWHVDEIESWETPWETKIRKEKELAKVKPTRDFLKTLPKQMKIAERGCWTEHEMR